MSRSRGSAALFCAPVPLDITVLRRYDNRVVVVVEGETGPRTRSRSRTGRSTVALYSPLSENMSEFFLLAFLALFSGLFPCAEPSAVSGEERGKDHRAVGDAQSGGNLAPRGRLIVLSGLVTGTKCAAAGCITCL